MESTFPQQLTRFMFANEQHKTYDSKDIHKHPWVKFCYSWPRYTELVNIIKTVNWPEGEYNTFSDSSIKCCELYTIKDWNMYKQANNHPTPELFEAIGCDVTSAFADHAEIIHDLMQFLPFDRYFRIHVNILPPGGFLLPHKDWHVGSYSHGLRHKITMALNLPDGFAFKLWGAGIVPLEEARPIAINTSDFLHAVVNDSNEDRYMLHVKGLPNDPVAYEQFLSTQNLDCS